MSYVLLFSIKNSNRCYYLLIDMILHCQLQDGYMRRNCCFGLENGINKNPDITTWCSSDFTLSPIPWPESFRCTIRLLSLFKAHTCSSGQSCQTSHFITFQGLVCFSIEGRISFARLNYQGCHVSFSSLFSSAFICLQNWNISHGSTVWQSGIQELWNFCFLLKFPWMIPIIPLFIETV